MTKSNTKTRATESESLAPELALETPETACELPSILAFHGAKEKNRFEGVLSLLYPPLCLACGEETDTHPGLCANCWAQVHFISGAICECCGTPLPEMAETETAPLFCDFCLHDAPSWRRGRAVVVYKERGRNIVMSLKHGDRLDIAKVIGRWMIGAGREIARDCDVIAPVPLYWLRLLKRKFNQSAALAMPIARAYDLPCVPDLLVRHKQTKMQKDMPRLERFANQASAIAVNPRFAEYIKGKKVLLIDDVMTTGATLRACSGACLAAGAAGVNVLVFARVANDGWGMRPKKKEDEKGKEDEETGESKAESKGEKPPPKIPTPKRAKKTNT